MKLTEQECNVIYYLVQGYNNVKIGEKLSISKHTVKAHLESIYEKLGVSNRIQASIRALQIGIIKLEDVEFENRIMV